MRTTIKNTYSDIKELAVLNILPPDDIDEFGGLANALIDEAGDESLLSAPDYDGTTGGNTNGINVLIERDDLESWEAICGRFGCASSVAEIEVQIGRYGDGHWAGVTIATDGDRFYWIE